MGPFTASTNAGQARISSHFNDGAAEPMTILDAGGDEISGEVSDGTELFALVPEDADWTDSGSVEAWALRHSSGTTMVGDGPSLVMLNYTEEVQV